MQKQSVKQFYVIQNLLKITNAAILFEMLPWKYVKLYNNKKANSLKIKWI